MCRNVSPSRRTGALRSDSRGSLGWVRTPTMPSISGRVEVNLTVTDPAISARWYSSLLGLEELYDHTGADNQMRYIALRDPRSQFVLGLVGHAANDRKPFSEFRTGLDHLEFMVDRREDLDQWATELDQLGISHSGVKTPNYTRNAMLTFRDPDHIQLEFFWRAPATP
jgi:glyoxylase I family protein